MTIVPFECFCIEYCKTKTKITTTANQDQDYNALSQTKLKQNSYNCIRGFQLTV